MEPRQTKTGQSPDQTRNCVCMLRGAATKRHRTFAPPTTFRSSWCTPDVAGRGHRCGPVYADDPSLHLRGSSLCRLSLNVHFCVCAGLNAAHLRARGLFLGRHNCCFASDHLVRECRCACVGQSDHGACSRSTRHANYLQRRRAARGCVDGASADKDRTISRPDLGLHLHATWCSNKTASYVCTADHVPIVMVRSRCCGAWSSVRACLCRRPVLALARFLVVSPVLERPFLRMRWSECRALACAWFVSWASQLLFCVRPSGSGMSVCLRWAVRPRRLLAFDSTCKLSPAPSRSARMEPRQTKTGQSPDQTRNCVCMLRGAATKRHRTFAPPTTFRSSWCAPDVAGRGHRCGRVYADDPSLHLRGSSLCRLSLNVHFCVCAGLNAAHLRARGLFLGRHNCCFASDHLVRECRCACVGQSDHGACSRSTRHANYLQRRRAARGCVERCCTIYRLPGLEDIRLKKRSAAAVSAARMEGPSPLSCG